MPRWWLGRFIRVVTGTGHWEYCRIVGYSPWHFTVRDARGHEYVVARIKR